MSHFLSETRKAISDSKHTVSDIHFIGSRDGKYECSWAEFEKLADFSYYEGFGGAEVASDLIIVFSDGNHLWRGEYDGSEWWEFDDRPVVPTVPRHNINALHGEYWNSLDRMHQRSEGEDLSRRLDSHQKTYGDRSSIDFLER